MHSCLPEPMPEQPHTGATHTRFSAHNWPCIYHFPRISSFLSKPFLFGKATWRDQDQNSVALLPLHSPPALPWPCLQPPMAPRLPPRPYLSLNRLPPPLRSRPHHLHRQPCQRAPLPSPLLPLLPPPWPLLPFPLPMLGGGRSPQDDARKGGARSKRGGSVCVGVGCTLMWLDAVSGPGVTQNGLVILHEQGLHMLLVLQC